MIARARGGDPAAFEALVTPHIPTAFRTALLMTQSRDSAQEAVQEALIEVFRSLARFRPGSPFRPWFLKIVTYRALNQHRRTQNLVTMDDAPELSAENGNPERDLLHAEQRNAIWQAVQEMDPEHRAVVVLYYYQELPVAEVAAMLDIPAGTVKSRLHAARRQIQRALQAAPTPNLSVNR